MTALEYMEKQVQKLQKTFIHEYDRGAPEDVLNNIKLKIGYYESAVSALKRVGVVEELEFDYSAECD